MPAMLFQPVYLRAGQLEDRNGTDLVFCENFALDIHGFIIVDWKWARLLFPHDWSGPESPGIQQGR